MLTIVVKDVKRLEHWWHGVRVRFQDGKCLEIGAAPQNTQSPHYLKLYECSKPDHYLAHIILFPIEGENPLHDHVIRDMVPGIEQLDVYCYLVVASATLEGETVLMANYTWDADAWSEGRNFLAQTGRAQSELQFGTMKWWRDYD